MQKIQYIKDYKENKAGDVQKLQNNIAHGLVERGIAILYRGRMFKSPVDKMMRAEEKIVTETRGERRARQREEASKKSGKGYRVK